MRPRKASEAELSQLAEYLILKQGLAADGEDAVSVRSRLESAAIAVFDHYITDGPGYAGKLMVVVWSGSPELYEAYVWGRGDELRYVYQDPHYQQANR